MSVWKLESLACSVDQIWGVDGTVHDFTSFMSVSMADTVHPVYISMITYGCFRQLIFAI